MTVLLLGNAISPLPAFAAERITFPRGSGVINIKRDYGAKGDGTTDDTAVIQAVINKYQDKWLGSPIIYFPNGTYVVSDNLHWNKLLELIGQSRDGVIIKLKDYASGYGDPSNPKAVISAGFKAGYQSNTNFHNDIFNLTVDTGTGNPGAIGIEYSSNNQGSMRDIVIKSDDGKGKLGLSLLRDYAGPALIKRVTIDGFQVGVDANYNQYGMTFEHLDIRNFTVAGVRNSGGMMLAIQDLNTRGSGPAIVQPSDGLIVVVGAKFTGTGATAHAVSNAVSNNGHLYLRNASVVSGYSDVLPGQGPSVAEYMSHTPISLFPSPTRSLNLPIQETPELPWDSNFSHWANVMDYGANPYDNTDDSAAIQAAIDSGKPIIYFPMAKNPTVPNYFTISHTIIIRGNVQKILGLGSIFRLGNPLAQSSNPIFRVENTTGNAIFFDNIGVNRQGVNSPVFIEHASPKTVVIRNAALGAHSYRAVPGAGDLFVEDVEGTTYQLVAGQHVWARQINPEESGAGTLIHNDGASLWILGLKTEGADTVVETLSGGSTEILGAELGWNNGSSHPMFISNESSFTANYYLNSSGWYDVHVRETRDGITKDLLPSQLPADWWAYVTLYTGM